MPSWGPLIVALTLLTLSSGGCAAHRPDAGGGRERSARMRTASPASRSLLRECRTAASRIRQLPFQRRVAPAIEDPPALEASVSQAVDRELPPERLELRRLELFAFGFVPGDFDLAAFLKALYAEQLAGYYDPRHGRLVLVRQPEIGGGAVNGGARLEAQEVRGGTSDAEGRGGTSGAEGHRDLADPSASILARLEARGVTVEKALLVHELVHALQDQNLGGLSRLLEPAGAPLSGDRLEARRALVEGDASFVMTQYLLGDDVDLSRLTGVADRALDAVSAGLMPGTRVLAGAPRIFRDRLLFSYYHGLELVSRLLRDGGWAVVNRAYAAPPISTEQVLHPGRYLEGEQPHQVEIGPLPGLEALGYAPIAEGTQGELGMRSWLAMSLDREDAAQAATGWGGDRYRVYRRDGHRPLLVWATSWDGPEEAAALEAALERHARRWMDRPPLLAWHRSGDRVSILMGDDIGLEPLLSGVEAAVRVTRLAPAPPPLLQDAR